MRARYRDLPVDPAYPPGSAWGAFGEEDEVGTVNLLDADQVRRAARLVRRGAVFPLNWSLELPDPALFGRQVVRHRIIELDPVGVEDAYDGFYPQGSSQWDALAHIRHPEFGYYLGRASVGRETAGSKRTGRPGRPGSGNGIHHWARRGIVGRFVLADVARWRAQSGQPIDPATTDPIGPADLDACLAEEDVTLDNGDILLVRFGWIGWYESADGATRRRLAASDTFAAPGLANSEGMLEWLWDHGVAAVAGDNPALEVQPFDESRAAGYLHYRLIALLGFAVGELFDLDALAADCADDGIYEGLFAAAPLNKADGAGSPANALAIK